MSTKQPAKQTALFLLGATTSKLKVSTKREASSKNDMNEDMKTNFLIESQQHKHSSVCQQSEKQDKLRRKKYKRRAG